MDLRGLVDLLAVVCEPLVLLDRRETFPDVQKLQLREKSEGAGLFRGVFLEQLVPQEGISVLRILELLYQLGLESHVLVTAS